MELSSVYSHPCIYVLWLYGLSEGSGTCGNCQFARAALFAVGFEEIQLEVFRRLWSYWIPCVALTNCRTTFCRRREWACWPLP